MKNRRLVPVSLRKKSQLFWAFLLFVSFEGSILSFTGFGKSYSRGIFTSGPVAVINTINAFISLIGGANMAVLMAIPGIFYLLWVKHRDKVHIFLIITLISIFPLLQFRVYSRPFVSVFLIILGAYGVYWGMSRLNKKKFVAALITLCLISLAFTSIMLSHWGSVGLQDYSWNSRTENINGDRYGIVVYAHNSFKENGSFISNSWGYARYFQSYVNKPNAPPMHGLDAISLLIYGYVTPEEISNEVSIIPLDQPHRYIENEGPFALSGVESYYIGEADRLTKTSIDSMVAQKIMDNYETQFIITNKALGLQQYDRWYNLRDSKFFSSLRTSSYKNYESEGYVVWIP